MIDILAIPVVYIGLFNACILVSICIFGAMAYGRLSSQIEANAAEANHLLALVKLHGQMTDNQTAQVQGVIDTIKPAVKVLEKQAAAITKIVTSTNDIVVEDRPNKV